MLALSREPSGPSPAGLQTIDPDSLLKQTAKRATRRLGVTLELRCPLAEAERLVWVDPNRLVQGLDTLIDNSAKDADRSQAIELFMESDPGASQLLIGVADRGETLSQNSIAQLFTPFYRAANARGQTGTGRGLTVVQRLMVQRLVAAMGGSVKAEARRGGGLRISLQLAQAPDRRSQPRSPGPEQAPGAQNHPLTPPKGGRPAMAIPQTGEQAQGVRDEPEPRQRQQSLPSKRPSPQQPKPGAQIGGTPRPRKPGWNHS